MKKPIALVILDGWGIGRADDPSNAIYKTATPNMDELTASFPTTRLACSGEAVGLPDGQMGNSEVGHLNIGAGRVVYQELTRITKAIRDKDFFQNPVLCKIIEQAKLSGGALHLMGLLSDGGVHSHITHLYALVELAKEYGLKDVYIHAYLDGRDVPPSSGIHYIDALEGKLKEIGLGKIATVAGRYYAMDRDKRWDRVEKAYNALVYREGLKAASAHAAVVQSYEKNETDEFVLPTVIESAGCAGIKANDGVIFFNFRPDRGREMTRALVDPKFTGFMRKSFFPLYFVTMTQYDETLPVEIAYPPQAIHNTLGEIFCARGLKQLRIAETEKYAHVTFFFNGGEEKPCAGEDRILIASPKVATYDLQPEMSAVEVTDRLVGEIAESKYDLIILNFANGDMVGHTGFIDAAMKAVSTVDTCVGRVVKAMRAEGGIVCITADHGNADMMVDPATGEPFTAHTTNPVPFILVSDEHKQAKLREGILADISPTILRLAGIEQPAEMTGASLIK
ncbi:MAG: 2,3-bisphosphoglycerate-independent phosphoglycerate mutase [Pelosinus sp.]|nr:2,3-bisphosphoglycerate-independent phosphoglycerate mutase [Pelosinus sp.]